MGCIPISVSVTKPVKIHTRGPWIWILADTGKDDYIFTHGLPVSNTNNIEPICYGTNINQSDKTRPNQVLLTLAGIFLHFDHHTDHSVVAGMWKRLEKRWKALDQPMFIFALILNPYERLDHFGDKAGVNVFSLNTLLMDVHGLLQH